MRCSILGDEQDRELERRGHRFVCYGDHANIYVPTPRSGQRVLTSVERFLWLGLKLTVNRKNSQIVGGRKCDYLGYVMSRYQQPRLRLATIGLGRLRDLLRTWVRSLRARKVGLSSSESIRSCEAGLSISSSARASGHSRNWMAGSGTNFAASSGANVNGP